jgi:hypothetical protein
MAKHLDIDDGVTAEQRAAAAKAAAEAVTTDGRPAGDVSLVDTTGSTRYLTVRKYLYRALTGLIPVVTACGWLTGEQAALIAPALAGLLGVALAAANTR